MTRTRKTGSRRRGAPPRLPAGICRTPDGCYRARPTSGRKRTPKTFGTLDEAKAYLRQQELAGRSVRETLDLWMKERPNSVKPSTLSRDKQIVRNLPKDFLSLDLASITFSEVSAVVNGWPGKDGTRKRVRTTLQAFFTWCVRKKFIDETPARDIRVAETSPPSGPNPFTWDRIQEIADATRDKHPYIADAMLLAAHTGVRLGELRAIRVGDYVQVPHQHLRISHNHPENQAEETTPKSGKSRFIPLDPVAAAIVKRLAAGRAPDEYLLVTERGCQINSGNMRRAMGWKDLADGHNWKDLRHTAAVEWCRLPGSPLQEIDIQRLLGHSKLSTTEGYLAGLGGTRWQNEISAKFQAFGTPQTPDSRHDGGAA